MGIFPWKFQPEGALFGRGGDGDERGSTGAGIFEPWSALSRGVGLGIWDETDGILNDFPGESMVNLWLIYG